MKTRYAIASILIFVGAIIHAVGGELININALLHADIPQNLKIEIRASWYLVAIDFIFSGIYLIYFLLRKKINDQIVLINFIGVRMLFYGICFVLIILITDSRLLFQVPQWILLLIIGIIIEWDFFRIHIKKLIK